MPKAFLIRKKLSGRDHWRPVTPPPSPDEEDSCIKKDSLKEDGINSLKITKGSPLKLDHSSNHAFSPSYSGLILSSPSSCCTSDSDNDFRGILCSFINIFCIFFKVIYKCVSQLFITLIEFVNQLYSNL